MCRNVAVQKTLRNFESRSNMIARDISQLFFCRDSSHVCAHFDAFHVSLSAVKLILLKNLFVVVSIASYS
jgi:hypothetical protein